MYSTSDGFESAADSQRYRIRNSELEASAPTSQLPSPFSGRAQGPPKDRGDPLLNLTKPLLFGLITSV